jgi:hypothetical protein
VHLEADVSECRLEHRSEVLLVVDEEKRLTSHALKDGGESWEVPVSLL